MPHFLPVAMTALTVVAAQAFGSGVDWPLGDPRELAIAPGGYDQVGQTLVGVVDSVNTITGTSDVEFGTVLALSDDGLRLAVSARRHDWVSEDDSGPGREDAGAVFIYDFVGSTWVYRTHFVGDLGEELGRWPISLSSDGQTIAIRRGSGLRPVEVWQVDASGNKVQLGGDITCTDFGSMLSLTELTDGTTRLAAGCEFYGSGDSGIVQILDWDGSAWVNVTGSPLSVDATGTTAGLFGFDMAWALDGTRLALSAPNYQDTLLEQGLVRVYDFDGTSWTQLGADLKGAQASEKFGFTIGMSSDGFTLVIGSPMKDNGGSVNSGAVQVYTLSETTWLLQDEEFGSDPGDQFGRGISVKSDGTLFCASSAYHNSDRGQVRIFQLLDSSWTTIAEFEGTNVGDLLGFNNMGVTMTNDGTRLAMASIHAQTNGIVQVFDAPVLGAFDWDIDRVGDAEIVFSEDADASEIKLHYNISLRDTKIEAFQADCTTPIPTNVTSLTSELVPTSALNANFTVNVNIEQDAVTDYPGVWTDVATGEGLISMCIRVDLLLDDVAETSVTFHEQKVFVSVGLLQGFEVTGIDLSRLNATEETGTADFDYNVTACHCNSLGTCINTVLTQGSDVLLCVETSAPNVEISDIRELTMTQGAFNTTPIVAGAEDALTVTTITGKEATIQYQIISAFFSDPDPLDIVASGSVLLAFTDDDGRRLLRSAKVVGVQDVQGFDVQMPVRSALEETSGACGVAAGGFVSLLVIVIGGVAGVMDF